MSSIIPQSKKTHDKLQSLLSDYWPEYQWKSLNDLMAVLVVGVILGACFTAVLASSFSVGGKLVTPTWALQRFFLFGFSAPLLLYGFILYLSFLHDWTTREKRQAKYDQEIAILEKENQRDYEQAGKLTYLFDQFSRISVAERKPVETVIEGVWKPFRVEHNLSSSLKASLTSRVISGSVVPNMLDSCTTIFLRDGNNTLRVLLPSPMATRELFARSIQAALKGTEKGTHTAQAIQNFRLDDEHLITPLYQPAVIDRLDAACDQAIEHRPVVIVKAQPIQDGVVLGSSLTIEGEEYVFIPSGYFAALTESISSLLGYAVEAPSITHVLAV